MHIIKHNEHERVKELIITSGVLAALATAFTVARIVAKRMRQLTWAWDDTLIATGLFCLYMCVTISIVASTHGEVGHHINSMRAEELRETLIMLYCVQFPMVIGLTVTRFSISLLFLRIFFTKMYPKLRFAAYLCMAFAAAWFLVAIIITLSHCRPMEHNWRQPLENPQHCFSFKPYQIYISASGLILDAIIWLLPHHVVWKLQLRRVHKIAITSMFALGLLNIVMAVFRIISTAALDFQGDLTYDVIPAMIWGLAQVSTAVILACCPLLRPLFEKMVPKRLTRIATNRQYTARSEPIRIITNIAVHPDTSGPRTQAAQADDFLSPAGPVFEVAPLTPTKRRKSCHELCSGSDRSEV